MWKLNNTLLNNQTRIQKGKSKKYLKTNENKNKTYQNLLDTAKAVVRGNFIAINAYIKKKEKSQITALHLKETQKEKQPKPKISKKRK